MLVVAQETNSYPALTLTLDGHVQTLYVTGPVVHELYLYLWQLITHESSYRCIHPVASQTKPQEHIRVLYCYSCSQASPSWLKSEAEIKSLGRPGKATVSLGDRDIATRI